MIKKFTLLTAIISLLFLKVNAQAPDAYNAADIAWQLQKLQVLGSVLYIGAHPDDENTRLLTYLSKEKKYRTAYLSLTRGDGGQNLIGDEQGVPLGLIRTQELLAARRIDGGEQFFSRAYDFGFSKNPEETFKIWDKEKILSDVVWVIRYFKPDIIITRFPEDSRAGHGHHSASAILAREAFYAAADTSRFPEQIRSGGLTAWQAKRLLWNNFNFGSVNTIRADQFKMDVGGYNSLLGKSYGEIAALSRSQHKSQGFGVLSSRGTAYEYFTTIAGEAPVNDLMDGVDLSWKRTGDNLPGKMIDTIIADYQVLQPERSLPALLALYRYFMNAWDPSHWMVQKRNEVTGISLAAMGMYFEATARQQFAVTDDSMSISFTIVNRSHFPLKKIIIGYEDTVFVIKDQLSYNVPKTITYTCAVRGSFLAGQPYWLREQMTEGSFTIPSQSLLARPQNVKNDVVVSYFPDDKTAITQSYPLQYKYADPVKGEIYEPVITTSPVLVGISPGVVLMNVVPKVKPGLVLHYEATRTLGSKKAAISFSGGKQMVVKDHILDLSRNRPGEIVFDPDTLFKIKDNTEISAGISLKDSINTTYTYANNIRLIRYDHIPTVHYFYQPKIKFIADEIRVAGKRIGYIKGAGDYVPEALKAMGYEVVILNENDLTPGKLATLDAVITGVRAYNIHAFLSARYPVLMDYVKKGGNLIVQYNTNNFVGGEKVAIGPYPFTISNRRVTNEKAPVKFLQPDHAVLNYPNKITEKDFDNWIQERGIYFAEQADPAFEMPLSMADPGEQEQKGSLLIASYGKGKFVYTGLVFFRELPAGIPGAYRLLANIIALNKKKGF